jgi:hypothetical protein
MSSIVAGTIYVVICGLVGFVAGKFMYRSVLGWTVLALLFSPVLTIVFLLVAGPPVSAADQVREDEEAERLRKSTDHERHAQSTCPACGDPINPATGQGVRSSGDEPWRLSCANCAHEISGY